MSGFEKLAKAMLPEGATPELSCSSYSCPSQFTCVHQGYTCTGYACMVQFQCITSFLCLNGQFTCNGSQYF